MKTLVITDNPFLLRSFASIANKLELSNFTSLDYASSPGNKIIFEQEVEQINLKHDWVIIIRDSYDLVISLHCKQLFPKEMVEAVRCVNIHPGYNPYNRGWYPQVFSIINKLPLGATIHEIDTQLDHGCIIAQKSVVVSSHDTSLTAYNKVLQVELELIETHIVDIITNNYCTQRPVSEGNINLKKDFNNLLRIDLNEVVRVGDFIDRLRALTHGEYNNAFFENEDGNRIYVGLTLLKK